MAKNYFNEQAALTNCPRTVGRDTVSPYGVYLDGKQVAIYYCQKEAGAHYQRLLHSLMTATEIRRERDHRRTVLQSPISQTKQCVMYFRHGRECRSAWFYTEDRARQALAMMQAKYGERNAIIYVD